MEEFNVVKIIIDQKTIKKPRASYNISLYRFKLEKFNDFGEKLKKFNAEIIIK